MGVLLTLVIQNKQTRMNKIRPADLNSFAVINFGAEYDKNTAKYFVNEQLKVSKNHGINLPRGVCISDGLIDSLMAQAESTNPSDVSTLIVLYPFCNFW